MSHFTADGRDDMKRRILSAMLSAAIAVSAFGGFAVTASGDAPQYLTTERQMEKLNRGLIAVKVTNGVYLSWRLLGDEDLATQEFDIYRGTEKIYTTENHGATCYTDSKGAATSTYIVVPKGEPIEGETPTSVIKTNFVRDSNSYTYIDVPIKMPADVERMGDKKPSTYKRGKDSGGANDASVGDLDGDGDYEIVLKWDPQDSKDSAGADFTGNVYIDAYEIDPNNTSGREADPMNYKWRIDLGPNVTAGAHYTQFIVYDLNGDGKAEVAMKTAPGSKDGQGNYVSDAGDTDEIKSVDNEAQFIGTSGHLKGKNPFTQYLTIFDGATGKALYTTDFIPYEMHKDDDWGDGANANRYNRSERYLAAVAYLDGVHPSLIMCRGYYHDAVIRAYTWDGKDLSLMWEHNGDTPGTTMYGQGNHNLSVADVDNDGKDEIVYGSAVLDHDGKTVLGNTRLGHGDAIHVSDFNNDGKQEVFSVKEDNEGYKEGIQLRVAETGRKIWSLEVNSDNGRGFMDNVDDAYAAANPNALSLGWSAGTPGVYNFEGASVGNKPSASRSFTNFGVYWDGDLGRELLDDTIMGKYSVASGSVDRILFKDENNANSSYLPASSNNSTKYTPSLVADILGDWREEIIMPAHDDTAAAPVLRVLIPTISTSYRLTTLMHDSQYREAIAWQNVGYNQPPHTSYYIGSAALATDESGNKLNYLAPKTAFTNVTTNRPADKAVTDIALSASRVEIEKGRVLTINPTLTPFDAFPKTIVWESSDESVATVSQGTVKALSEGTTTITASIPGSGIKAECEVEVYINHVTGVTVSPSELETGTEMTEQLTAKVEPSNATNPSIIWSSEDESIATVDQNGNVTGVSEGQTRIVVEAIDGGHKAYCNVTVKKLQKWDRTGANEFVADNIGTGTSFTGTANSVTLSQNNAEAINISKEFDVYNDDITKVSFKVVTGGQRVDGSNWNWTGHEYTLGLKFLDTKGNNILTISQAFTSKAQTTKSVVANDAAQDINTNNWKRTVSDGENPIGRSTTRWFVELEFDYDKDTCTAALAGADGSWTRGIEYTKTFKLNGANFETLQFYTQKDGTGGITVSPSLSDLKYERITDDPDATPGPTKSPNPTPTPVPEPVDSLVIRSINQKTANVGYSAAKAHASAVLIGALYDGATLIEVKSKELGALEPSAEETATDIEFTNDIADYNLKIFLWESLGGMKPINSAATELIPLPTPVPTPTAVPTPTPVPTEPPRTGDEEFTTVFKSAENFLMEDGNGGKWITSSDSASSTRDDAEPLSEDDTDIGGNDTAKIHLADKAVQYVLDETITEGFYKLTYDMYIDKTTKPSSAGRYFRTYLDNNAHPFDTNTGVASSNGTDYSFFHMADIGNKVYTTSTVGALGTSNENDGVALSETELAEKTWYRVVIEGSLYVGGTVKISFYPHGDTYNPDVAETNALISAEGQYTEGRERAIKQIKFMRTQGGDIYYDNIKLEKYIPQTADEN